MWVRIEGSEGGSGLSMGSKGMPIIGGLVEGGEFGTMAIPEHLPRSFQFSQLKSRELFNQWILVRKIERIMGIIIYKK